MPLVHVLFVENFHYYIVDFVVNLIKEFQLVTSLCALILPKRTFTWQFDIFLSTNVTCYLSYAFGLIIFLFHTWTIQGSNFVCCYACLLLNNSYFFYWFSTLFLVHFLFSRANFFVIFPIWVVSYVFDEMPKWSFSF